MWIDFTLRTGSNSIGHYLPIHEAWLSSAKRRQLDWMMLGEDTFCIENLQGLSNLVTWPAHFTVFDIKNFINFLRGKSRGKLFFLVYEGEFVTFYFFLILSFFFKRELYVHFNWSNNSQLQQYCKRASFKLLLRIIHFLSQRNFIHYVENEHLKDLLNTRSRLEFNLFPTSTVFEETFRNETKYSKHQIALIINDKSISQNDFIRIISIIDSLFEGFEIAIFSYKKYVLPQITSNHFVEYIKQLDRNDYFSVLQNTWISFFFYNEENYRFLTSGRYLDCLFVESLICVPHQPSPLDWLGSRFGNLVHFDFEKCDLPLLAQSKFVKPDKAFSPENTVASLVENSQILLKQKSNYSFMSQLQRVTLALAIFIILQTKFALLLLKRFLHKKKLSILNS